MSKPIKVINALNEKRSIVENQPIVEDPQVSSSTAYVSPVVSFQTYDSTEERLMGSNLISYFQNLLYYDRGCRMLAPPPGGFEESPTSNLLLQILESLSDKCANNTVSETLDIKSQSLEYLIETLLTQMITDTPSIAEVNNFLLNLSYLIYPNTFYTTDDCQLATVLEVGPEKYYGIVRGYHSLGRALLCNYLGKKIPLDCGKWVKLGTKQQYIKTLECVKIQGDCLAITNTSEYKKYFSDYHDWVFRDRLLLYLAFIKWCVKNVWSDNLLAFVYSSYNTCHQQQACALTLEIVESGTENSGYDHQKVGTVIRFLHSEDSFHEVDPPQCPPVYLNMIEGGRGLSNCYSCDFEADGLCLYVPKAYWDLIVELQVQCYPGGKKECYPQCKEEKVGPVQPAEQNQNLRNVKQVKQASRKPAVPQVYHPPVKRGSKNKSKESDSYTYVSEYEPESGGSSVAPSTVVFQNK